MPPIPKPAIKAVISIPKLSIHNRVAIDHIIDFDTIVKYSLQLVVYPILDLDYFFYQ